MLTRIYNWKLNFQYYLAGCYSCLRNKYETELESQGGPVWIIVALVVLAAVGLYAWYCTSRGMNFGFNVRFTWPRSGSMGIGFYK